MLTVGIPFNRWLGYQVEELTPSVVIVSSPERILRKNHVGGAHACALALLGEMPAGLLIAQNFPIDEYRFIISELHIVYHKQGRGILRGTVHPPIPWPSADSEDITWVDLTTYIKNEAGEDVATCKTRWQIKRWEKVRGKSGFGWKSGV